MGLHLGRIYRLLQASRTLWPIPIIRAWAYAPVGVSRPGFFNPQLQGPLPGMKVVDQAIIDELAKNLKDSDIRALKPGDIVHLPRRVAIVAYRYGFIADTLQPTERPPDSSDMIAVALSEKALTMLIASEDEW